MSDAGAEDGHSPLPRPQSHSHGADYGSDEPHHENGDRDRKGERHSRESGRDREKSREKDKDREKDRRGHRDDRDRGDRDRSDRADRGDRGERDRSERHRSHDRERNRRDYGDQDGTLKRRSCSTSLSRSPTRDSRRETIGFDMPPPGATVVPGAPIPGQIPGMPPQTPGVLPSMLPLSGTQFGGLPGMPAQAMTQQATRHARRVYVGGLPPMAIEQMQEVAGERGGYLHGRGALDSDDLLYLKEQMEAEEDAERLRRRTEKRAFAAFKKAASLVDSASISTLPAIRVEPKPRSGIRQQVLVKSIVKVKVERPSPTLDSGKSSTSLQHSYPQSNTNIQSQDLAPSVDTTKPQGGLLGLTYESEDDSDEDIPAAKQPKD